MLSRVVVERYFESALEWLERRRDETRSGSTRPLIGDALVYMTAEELRELDERIRALLEPYLKRLEDREPPAQGSRPVSFIALAFPLAEEPRGLACGDRRSRRC